ncbi:hypothetical protein TI04_03425 [Achromatium sp. WMS2]|nr:hypothetical protein TI04_03425 [Achromatium sp. WMS2]
MIKTCILGGSGFVGKHLLTRLAANPNLQVRVVTRNSQHRTHLMQQYPNVEVVIANVFNPSQLYGAFQDCQAVINLVGILNPPSYEHSFQRMHVDLIAAIIEAAEKASVTRYLHMSGLHANAAEGPSQYLFTKGQGEDLAHTEGGKFMAVTSFRPSVIFGPGDSFFNRFAGLLRLAPGFFPLACAESRFQPVFVGDVTLAFAIALEAEDDSTHGQRYNLCGPEVFTLRKLVEYTIKQLGLLVTVVGISDTMARVQGHVMGLLPGQPFSYDNYLSLQVDSVCTDDDFSKLGITPQNIDSIVPSYLKR